MFVVKANRWYANPTANGWELSSKRIELSMELAQEAKEALHAICAGTGMSVTIERAE